MPVQSWPNGKRLAVIVGVLLESWSEGKWPHYFTRTTPLKSGAIDHAGVQWAQFGGKEGVWRIMRVLDDCGVKGTIFANALAAERHPEVFRQAARSGHDVAGHGYAQDQYLLDQNPEAQQATIRRCLDILEQAYGKRPQGWGTPLYSWTPETIDRMVREGVQWHADALDTTLPRLERTPSGSIIGLPWSDFVDNRVLRASPRDFFEVYKDSFDYLLGQERMGLLHIAVHSHFGGRPLIAAMLHKLLRYLGEFREVWFAGHGDLAQWWREQKLGAIAPQERFFSGM